MKVNIKGKEIELKQTFRTMMIYENVANQTFVEQGSVTSILLYFYCNILGSCDNAGLQFDEFIDYIDANPDVLTEYSAWLTSQSLIDNVLKPIDKTEKKRKRTNKN